MRDKTAELCTILPFFKFDFKLDGDAARFFQKAFLLVPHSWFAIFPPFYTFFRNVCSVTVEFALNPALLTNKKILGRGTYDVSLHFSSIFIAVTCEQTINNI